MKNHITLHFTLFRYALTIFMVAGLLMINTPSASANVRTETGGNVPFYARLGLGIFYHTDDLAVVVFYRPPGCIPRDFNLLDFFDIPAAFGCGPYTTSGFEIWTNGPPPIDAAPILTVTQGLGAVPVWFVSWPMLEAAIADGNLTIGELESLGPLVGTANSYHETLRPGSDGGMTLNLAEFNADGTLEDGRSFQVTAMGNDRFTKTRIFFR